MLIAIFCSSFLKSVAPSCEMIYLSCDDQQGYFAKERNSKILLNKDGLQRSFAQKRLLGGIDFWKLQAILYCVGEAWKPFHVQNVQNFG